jgi:type II secretory ATPase GspE/PulE/Tfp pilus assembly ATPase PilB-like protein
MDELARIQRLVHSLCHRDRLSPKAASERLSAYMIDRSAEAIRADLAESRCANCPEHSPQLAETGPVTAVHHASPHTGMIGRDG